MDLTKILQISLLIFALNPRTSSQRQYCPGPCKCTKNAIFCTNQRLKAVAKNYTIQNATEIFDLSGNYLEALDKSDFALQGISHVKELYLNDSNVADLSSNTFSGFAQLEVLDLSENVLEQVPSRLIQGNKKLLVLRLSTNLFFRRTPELASESLEVLDLSSSQISSFGEKNVIGLPNLRLLYLYANQIKYISGSTFGLTPRLAHVELAYNPWRCNCSVARLFEELVGKNLTTVDDPIRCRRTNKKFEDMYTRDGAVFAAKFCPDAQEPPNRHQADSSGSAPEDSSRGPSTGAPGNSHRKVPEDISSKVPEDSSGKIPEASSRKIPEDYQRKIHEDSPRKNFGDSSRGDSEDSSRDEAGDSSRNEPADFSKNELEGFSKNKLDDSSKNGFSSTSKEELRQELPQGHIGAILGASVGVCALAAATFLLVRTFIKKHSKQKIAYVGIGLEL